MKLKNTMLALAIAMASTTGFAADSADDVSKLKEIIGTGEENDEGLLTAFKNLYTEVYGELVPNSDGRTVGGLRDFVDEIYFDLYGNEDREGILEEDKHPGLLAKIDEGIKRVEESIPTAQNLAPVRKQVNENSVRLDKLTKETRNGLAAQAALNGLFQPYNVGKVNVTAALGGYKSATALAVGAGFRATEKFAVKAAVATPTNFKGLSYNVGVNYEF
ncbi:hypothetical protein GVX76_02760 [[Haemophilus] felis]|nr:hypothetical protein [[Haemophilus] felis]